MFSFFHVILVFYSVNICSCLFEDQIGKFEWRQQYVGKPIFSHMDISSHIKKIIVGTEHNVIAAMSLKFGDIIWKQVLEPGDNGKIRLLHMNDELVTISGMKSPIVRGWEPELGLLLWEWVLPRHDEYTKWTVVKQNVIQIDFVPKTQINVTLLSGSNGRKMKSQVIPSPWLNPESCVVQSEVLCCTTNDKLIYSVKLTNEGDDLNIKVHHRSLLDLFKEEITGELKGALGPLPIVTINVQNVNKLILLVPEIRVLENGDENFQIFTTVKFDEYKFLTSALFKNNELILETRDLKGKIVPELNTSLTIPNTYGRPESIFVVCQPRKDKGVVCRLLMITSHSVMAVSQYPGKILWSREESLSSIITVEMVDLPVSDMDVAIEKEFDNKNSGFVGMFIRRLVSQFFQLQNLFFTVVDIRGDPFPGEKEGLIRDDFGLHKIIVVVTNPGKICGIDSLTGKIIWQVIVDDVKAFSSSSGSPVMPLFVLRTARHSPLPAKCAVLGMDKTTGKSVLIVFNPITGSLEDPDNGIIKLQFRVKQSMLSRHADEEFLKGVIFLDEENKVHVFPTSSTKLVKAHASSTYIYTADSSGVFEGFGIVQGDDGGLVGSRNWLVNLCPSGDKIVAIVGKNVHERVHSQGRVLADRSVLYKYVNPNLLAVMTQRPYPSSILNLYLMDAVTGNIVYSVTHRRARDPIHLVHSENWVIYTYFNDKYRRTELSALELYEGKTQSNATAFSSIDSAVLQPIAEKQAYILPANVLALKETITEKGITSKHILVALTNGGILELPWMYADPRRPVTVTPEMREEGVIPYMPELPILLEAIINHNQTITKVRGIHTSSSGLESTCLVFVYGLDIFYTRVAPSKMFDLLKDDFDYFVIATVLLILVVISFITKRLASRKALKQAWK